MAKKICNWNEAKPEGTFDSKATANEYVRGRMAEFNILRDADLTPETWARAFRFDFSAAMSSTLSDKMRKFGSLLVRDSTPKKGNTNYTRPVTISEVKDMNVDRMMVLYHVPHTNFLKKWLMEQKKLGRYKWNSPNNNLVRKEFNDLVGRAIRGEQIALSELGYTTGEAQKLIQQMAKVQSQLLNEQLQMLKIVGVEGAENIVDNFNYLTRVHNPIKYQKILDDPTKGSQYLKVFLVNAMEDTMLKGVKQKPLTAAQKMTIAENLITVVNRSNFSKGGVNLDHIVTSMQKRETFRRMMQEHTNMVDEEIDALINRMFKVKPGEQVSGSSYLKRRIRFNEGYTDGRTNFSDLLENNAEALFMNYTHSAMGDMALAYKGIKSRGDFQRIRQEIVESYDANPKASATKRAVWQAKNEIQAMDMAYAYIKGRPLAENPTGLAPTIGRFIRKLNYSRVMNQVGFANMSEMGNVTGLIGWNATLKNVPELRRMMKRLENGERVDEFIREIDYTMGQ